MAITGAITVIAEFSLAEEGAKTDGAHHVITKPDSPPPLPREMQHSLGRLGWKGVQTLGGEGGRRVAPTSMRGFENPLPAESKYQYRTPLIPLEASPCAPDRRRSAEAAALRQHALHRLQPTGSRPPLPVGTNHDHVAIESGGCVHNP